ncbi:MAG: hypothetical protein KF888_13145 [Nitrosomonas sp.]|nr:hypothetical protein [Nitrosomonas sp.]
MITFPNSPKILKGAIVGTDPMNPLASIIAFQYNLDTVTRTLQVQSAGDGRELSEAMQLKGPPIKTIKMDVEIDATDQLEKADHPTIELGIYPQLSALEMLVYPKSTLVIANTASLEKGTIEVLPPMGPFTLLIWGMKRVIPVRLTDFSVTEENWAYSYFSIYVTPGETHH